MQLLDRPGIVARAALAIGLDFYARDARVVAPALLGAHLVVSRPGRPARIARIVETEAYRGPGDRACHASKGLTARTKTLLGPPAFAYVYLIYGMHDCFNVVCGGEGERGHAVLIRAVEALEGVEEAARTDGPGRLCRALGISRADDGASLLTGEIRLERGTPPRRIARSARVGVAYAGAHASRILRFYDAASADVSRPSPRTIGLGAQAPAKTRGAS